MNTCKNCRYYEIETTAYEEASLVNGYCLQQEICSTYMQIKDIKTDNKMVSCSEYGDDTKTLVGRNFGCIHFENKT